jgi:hypothetical protein
MGNLLDIADNAQAVIELHLQQSIDNRKSLSIPFSGSCLCCQEPVIERRFCDSFCREDYEQRVLRKQRS